MARIDDFNDRQTQIDAENEPYHQYDYQTDSNGSWAGALPVKQYVHLEFGCTLCGSHYTQTVLINRYRGLYDPSLEKDACGVGFAW